MQLRFGPNDAAKLSVTLYLPKDQSHPSPIFLCDSERYIVWAEGAMAEGFGVAIHSARDPGEGAIRGNDESLAYADLFGNYDWSAFRRVKAGREFELLCTNRFGERITASPAVSGDELFYRTDSHVYCIGKNRRR